jgi:PAS domain S-box-containing protein
MKSTLERQDIEELFKILGDDAPVGMCIMQDGKFCCFNSSFPIATGYTAAELVGRDSLEIVAPEDRDMVRENTMKMLKGELLSPYQFRVIHKDGGAVWIMGTVKSIQYHGRRATLGNYMEVTERKQAEERIRESETRYRLLAENVEDVIWTVDIACPTRLTYISSSVTRLLGYGVEESMAKEMEAVFTPASFDIAMKAFAEEMLSERKEHSDGHRSRRLELQLRHKDGSLVDVEVNFSLIRGADGQNGEILAVARDISERKQMEQALADSEARHRELANSITDVFFAMDENLRYTYWNRASEILTEVRAEDAIGKSIQQVFPDRPWRRRAEKIYRRVLKTQQVQTFVMDFDINGRWYVLEISVYPSRGGISVFGRDIVERRQAEEALKQSEERYRSILEEMGDGYFETDLAGNLTFVNDALIDLLGYSRKEITGMNFRALRPKEEGKAVFEAYNRMYKTGQPLRNFPSEIICKDGRHIFAETTAFPTTNDKGEITGFRGVRHDITERRKAEEALQKSEERYRALAENACEAILVVQNDVVKFINAKGVELSGYSPEELASRPFIEFIHPDDVSTVVERNARRLKGEPVPQTYDFRIIRKDGQIRWGELNAVPISWEDRPAVLCFMSDITERKQIQEALSESEERYRRMFEEALDAIFIADADTGIVLDCNHAACELVGRERSELIGRHQRVLHPTETIEGEFSKTFHEHLHAKEGKVLEAQVVTGEGGIKEVAVKANVFEFRGRNVIQGIFRDVTERKQAERALRNSEERYRTMLEEMEDAYSEVDLGGHFTFVNNSLCRDLGYSREELLGTSYKKVTAEDDIDSVFRVFNEVYRTGLPNKGFAWKTIRKDGIHGFAESSISPIRNEKGEIIGFRNVGRDVSERKKAEEELSKTQAKLSGAVQMAHLGPWEYDAVNDLFIFNDAFYELFHTTAEKVGGYTMSSAEYTRRFVHPEDAHVVDEEVRKALQADDPSFSGQVDHRITYADGEAGHISVRFFIVKDEAGNTVRTYGVNQDITERKRAEEKLRQSEENYRALFDNSVIGTIVFDAETGNAVMANQAAARIFEFSSPQEGIGRNPLDFVPPEDKERVLEAFTKDLFEQDARRTAEFRALTKSGREIWLSVTAARIMHEGKLAGLVCFTDITEQKRQNERLMMTDRLASIGELASGTAHELNNPLTSIIGFSQLLMEREVPDDIHEDLKLINSEAQRAATITKNLLTFARKHAPVKQLSQINNVIEDVLRLRAYEHKVNNIEVVKQIDPGLPEMMIDYFQMQQVFTNIIINAEYFMTAANKRGTLTIATKKHNSTVRISIADDGPGIPPENMKRIFDPFFTTKEVGKGTGLGLSICHGIVTEHGGQIYVRSEVGKGATIHVELPINGSQPHRRTQ